MVGKIEKITSKFVLNRYNTKLSKYMEIFNRSKYFEFTKNIKAESALRISKIDFCYNACRIIMEDLYNIDISNRININNAITAKIDHLRLVHRSSWRLDEHIDIDGFLFTVLFILKDVKIITKEKRMKKVYLNHFKKNDFMFLNKVTELTSL